MKIGIRQHGRWIPVTIAALGFVLVVSGVAAADRSTAPGTFVGSDLITEDVEAAAKFYSALFDWDMEKAKDGYAIHHNGRLIASISGIQDDDPEVSRSFWLVGIVVNNLKGSLSAAQKNGAEIVEKAKKVSGGYGTYAVIRDAEGAPLMLIQPGKTPVGGTTGPGAWVWAELWTDDVVKASQFYTDVVGVGHEGLDRGGKPYHVFTSQGEPRTGVVKIPAELENVEPGWAPYVDVEDLTTTKARVKELGGQVIFATENNPARGAIALIIDPTGAALFIHQIGSSKEVTE